jgi:uncharacterized protein YqjF (DUF2071 family)
MPPFLTAEWRKLAIANYAVDPSILNKYLPRGTELDLWWGHCYVSLVAFRFENTRVKGFRIPYHTDFEEINLRFYIKHHDGTEWKRGVVFIKEIVPRAAIAFIARTLFSENYVTMRTAREWSSDVAQISVAYRWGPDLRHQFNITASSTPIDIASDSAEEFITEHYWGYTRVTDKATSEYQVEHPRWQVYPVSDYLIEVDLGALYGSEFAHLNGTVPASVFLAEGSHVSVGNGRRLYFS